MATSSTERTRARRFFSLEELRHAREVHGTTRTCTACGVRGNIDQMFGWRRMTPGGTEIRPQPQCYNCRAESWKKKR